MLCDQGSAADPAGELTALPQTPYSWILGREEREGERKGQGEDGRRREVIAPSPQESVLDLPVTAAVHSVAHLINFAFGLFYLLT